MRARNTQTWDYGRIFALLNLYYIGIMIIRQWVLYGLAQGLVNYLSEFILSYWEPVIRLIELIQLMLIKDYQWYEIVIQLLIFIYKYIVTLTGVIALVIMHIKNWIRKSRLLI